MYSFQDFDDCPVYITYYSQLRTNFNSTKEEVAKEVTYETGRRVTKIVPKSKVNHTPDKTIS